MATGVIFKLTSVPEACAGYSCALRKDSRFSGGSQATRHISSKLSSMGRFGG